MCSGLPVYLHQESVQPMYCMCHLHATPVEVPSWDHSLERPACLLLACCASLVCDTGLHVSIVTFPAAGAGDHAKPVVSYALTGHAEPIVCL